MIYNASHLLALIPDLHKAAIGTRLGHLQVPLGAGRDAEVLQAALLALVQQRALARGAQRRGAAAGRGATAAGAGRAHGRARLAPGRLGC